MRLGNVIRNSMLMALLLLTQLASAGNLPVWEVESANNRILLLGSVHMLRQSDYPLPAGIMATLDDADRLIMEVDMGATDPIATQQILLNMGSAKGRTLVDAMGPDAYAEAEERATELGISLLMFNQFEPWLAALTISQLRMMQLGFDPSWGIETQFTSRAAQAGIPTSGLETIEEQLSFMANMDDDTQREFLLQSLEDAAEMESMITSLISSWRNGDTEGLEDLLLEGFEEVPALADAILVQRNRNWVEQLIPLREERDNYLVVVGAMHLIGDDSVVAMLEDEGIDVRQLSDSDF